MTPINREFFVDFTQPPLSVEDLLPKSLRAFIRIDLLAVDSAPSTPPHNEPSIDATTVRQFFPLGKTNFVLSTTAHAPRVFQASTICLIVSSREMVMSHAG